MSTSAKLRSSLVSVASSQSSRWWVLPKSLMLLFLVVGVLSVGVVLIRYRPSVTTTLPLSSEGAEVDRHPLPAEIGRNIRDRFDETRLRALENRVAALDSESKSSSPASQAAPMTEEEQVDQHRRRFSDAIDAHRGEPVDEYWAQNTSISIENDLRALAKTSSFRINRVECRSRTCIANVQWDSYAVAARTYGAIVTATYAQNADVSMFILAPPDRSATYQADVLYTLRPTDSPTRPSPTVH